MDDLAPSTSQIPPRTVVQKRRKQSQVPLDEQPPPEKRQALADISIADGPASGPLLHPSVLGDSDSDTENDLPRRPSRPTTYRRACITSSPENSDDEGNDNAQQKISSNKFTFTSTLPTAAPSTSSSPSSSSSPSPSLLTVAKHHPVQKKLRFECVLITRRPPPHSTPGLTSATSTSSTTGSTVEEVSHSSLSRVKGKGKGKERAVSPSRTRTRAAGARSGRDSPQADTLETSAASESESSATPPNRKRQREVVASTSSSTAANRTLRPRGKGKEKVAPPRRTRTRATTHHDSDKDSDSESHAGGAPPRKRQRRRRVVATATSLTSEKETEMERLNDGHSIPFDTIRPSRSTRVATSVPIPDPVVEEQGIIRYRCKDVFRVCVKTDEGPSPLTCSHNTDSTSEFDSTPCSTPSSSSADTSGGTSSSNPSLSCDDTDLDISSCGLLSWLKIAYHRKLKLFICPQHRIAKPSNSMIIHVEQTHQARFSAAWQYIEPGDTEPKRKKPKGRKESEVFRKARMLAHLNDNFPALNSKTWDVYLDYKPSRPIAQLLLPFPAVRCPACGQTVKATPAEDLEKGWTRHRGTHTTDAQERFDLGGTLKQRKEKLPVIYIQSMVPGRAEFRGKYIHIVGYEAPPDLEEARAEQMAAAGTPHLMHLPVEEEENEDVGGGVHADWLVQAHYPQLLAQLCGAIPDPTYSPYICKGPRITIVALLSLVALPSQKYTPPPDDPEDLTSLMNRAIERGLVAIQDLMDEYFCEANAFLDDGSDSLRSAFSSYVLVFSSHHDVFI